MLIAKKSIGIRKTRNIKEDFHHDLDENPRVWRYMLAVASLPAILLLLGIRVFPESPRWLTIKGEISVALKILEKIRETKECAIAEFNEIQDNLMAIQRQDKLRFSELVNLGFYAFFLSV